MPLGGSDFSEVQDTDALLGQLCELRSVSVGVLHLSGSTVTDAGLATVSDLRDLENLNLKSTGVTDAGLRRLEGMKKLRLLDLRSCPALTREGIARLQKALPNCEIKR